VSHIRLDESKANPSCVAVSGRQLSLLPGCPSKGSLKLNLLADVEGCILPVAFTATVSLKYVAPALKLSKSSISLGSQAIYSTAVGLTVSPADYAMAEPIVRITDKSGKTDMTRSKPLNVEYRDGAITVGTHESTAPGTYKLWLKAWEGGKEVALTVNVLSPVKSAISSTVKASGALDMSIRGSSIKLVPSYKNYALTGRESFDYKINVRNGKTALGDQSELFNISKNSEGVFTVSAKDPESLNPKHSYSFVLTTVTENGVQTTAKEVKLTVKQSAIKLKLGKSSVSINPTVNDTVSVSLTSALKGYVIAEPIIEVKDKSGKVSAAGQLKVEYSGGMLHIDFTESTVPGSYKVLVRTAESQNAVTLTVNVLSGTKAKIKATQTVKGSIDVIRPGTEITVSAPKITGCSIGEFDQSLKIIAFSGSKKLGDYTERFIITKNDDGSAVIKATSAVDHSLKYKLQRAVYLPKGDSTVSVPMADAALQVKMGSAKLQADVKTVQLYAMDKNSVGQVQLYSTDSALSRIETVRIKKAKGSEAFTLNDFGGGKYAIGFAEGYARKTKGGSVALEIFLEGNHSSKANATVTVKVNVK